MTHALALPDLAGSVRRWCAAGAMLVALAGCDKPAAPAVFAEGQAFPAFMLALLSGDEATTARLHGKILVLNIWATWCPPCREEMPSLDRLDKTLDANRFAVLGLSIDADTLLAAEFLLKHRIGFKNYFDKDAAVTRQLGLKAYPETFVIAPDRTLLWRVTGMHDWSSADTLQKLERLYQQHVAANPGQTNVDK